MTNAYDLNARTLYGIDLNARALLTLLTVPAAPTSLTATAASSSQIDLAWTDNADNEDNYLIYRGTTSGNLSLIDTIAADSTAYSDTTVAASTTYYYQVRATNAAGNSDPSNEASDTTPAAFLVQDTFTDANGTLITAHAPDVDNGDTTYESTGPRYDIQSNTATSTATNAGARIDAGAVPSSATITLKANIGGRYAVVISEANTFANQGYAAELDSVSNTLNVVQNTTDLASTPYTPVNSNDHTLTITYDSGANELTASIDDGAGNTASVTAGGITLTNTLVGFWNTLSGRSVDDFEVTP